MSPRHSRWVRHNPADETSEVQAERAAIRLSMQFAKVVYDRRTELGLSQEQLGERAGLGQAKISRIEGSDAVPTVQLLGRLAKALDGILFLELDGDTYTVRFKAHADA